MESADNSHRIPRIELWTTPTINNTPGHSLRTNGMVELPLGPNKLVLGNSSGWLARAVERWQLGLIYNLSVRSADQRLRPRHQLYANGVPDIVYPVDLNELKGVQWGTQNRKPSSKAVTSTTTTRS